MSFANNALLSAYDSVPTSINRAIAFLTRPLILTQTPNTLIALKNILTTTLVAAYSAQRLRPYPRLVLSFSASSALPPRPVYAACIAAGVSWKDWAALLVGNRDFDIVIEPTSVVIVYAGEKPQRVTLWVQQARLSVPIQRALLARLNFDDVEGKEVPISKFVQSAVTPSTIQASLRATVQSARVRRQRTLAQELLEAEGKEDADEIFAMLSNTPSLSVLSPTPTRERFNLGLEIPAVSFVPSSGAFPSPLSSPEAPSSPESSRPSSRSSSVADDSSSTFSFSDDESAASSVSSYDFDFLASTKPRAPAPATIRVPVNVFNRRAPVFVPRASSTPASAKPAPIPSAAPRVFIDTAKKDVTKYLYQGGVSTVLTGGVMLGGGAAKASPKLAAQQTPKYRAPIGTGRRMHAPIAAATTQNAASANSWRRAARV